MPSVFIWFSAKKGGQKFNCPLFKLKLTQVFLLKKVASTYHKRKNEIANAITVRNENGKRHSSGHAEGFNNSIKTLIKDANGYKSERFRKRVLLVLGNKKDPSQ